MVKPVNEVLLGIEDSFTDFEAIQFELKLTALATHILFCTSLLFLSFVRRN